jgi:hypothetical protein
MTAGLPLAMPATMSAMKIMWVTTSRAVQPSHGDGLSHRFGSAPRTTVSKPRIALRHFSRSVAIRHGAPAACRGIPGANELGGGDAPGRDRCAAVRALWLLVDVASAGIVIGAGHHPEPQAGFVEGVEPAHWSPGRMRPEMLWTPAPGAYSARPLDSSCRVVVRTSVCYYCLHDSGGSSGTTGNA